MNLELVETVTVESNCFHRKYGFASMARKHCDYCCYCFADEVANSFDYFAVAAVVAAGDDTVRFYNNHRCATHSLDDVQWVRTNC